MKYTFKLFLLPLFLSSFLACSSSIKVEEEISDDPIDLVDPLIGSLAINNHSCPPLVQLPNSLLSISPLKGSFTSNYIEGLPLVSIPSLGNCQFYICPHTDTLSNTDFLKKPIRYTFDYESITPYDYKVFLDKEGIQCKYSLQENSGIYELIYTNPERRERKFILSSSHINAKFTTNTEHSIYGTFPLKKRGNLYLYLEANYPFSIEQTDSISQQFLFSIAKNSKQVIFRYGISLISHEQARTNLRQQIPSYEYNVVAKNAKNKWNTKLKQVSIEGGNIKQHKLFYTALYRTLSSPVCISENGYYYSPYDDSVHFDKNLPFYTIDNTSESFLSLHALRSLIFPDIEHKILNSYIRIIEEKEDHLFPSYPSLSGDISSDKDLGRMLEIFVDAYQKGITDIDIQKIYIAAKKYIEEKKADEYDLWAFKKLALLTGHNLDLKEEKNQNQIAPPSLKLIKELEPYNIRETIDKCGSSETFEKLLDETFENLLLSSCNVHNMYGYFLYAFTHSPYKGQKIMRHILEKNFRCDPAGFPPAIDNASLSASVVFFMLGFYPITAGIPSYTIGSPIFTKVVLDQGAGRHFSIYAENASKFNKYVSDVRLNDHILPSLHFSHSQIAQGGELKMKMSEIHKCGQKNEK